MIYIRFLFQSIYTKVQQQTSKNSLTNSNDSLPNITFYSSSIIHFPFSTNPPITRARNIYPPPPQKKEKKIRL